MLSLDSLEFKFRKALFLYKISVSFSFIIAIISEKVF